MGSLSIWHWLIVLAVILIIFGSKGRITSLFTDIAKGIKSFKKGISDEDQDSSHEKSTKD